MEISLRSLRSLAATFTPFTNLLKSERTVDLTSFYFSDVSVNFYISERWATTFDTILYLL